jgi:hypothetical protein
MNAGQEELKAEMNAVSAGQEELKEQHEVWNKRRKEWHREQHQRCEGWNKCRK